MAQSEKFGEATTFQVRIPQSGLLPLLSSTSAPDLRQSLFLIIIQPYDLFLPAVSSLFPWKRNQMVLRLI